MLNAGFLPDDHPQRYYTYSLLDPLDQPFATFRWYYRTWGNESRLPTSWHHKTDFLASPARDPWCDQTVTQSI